jgi:hypothetical protein
MEDTVAESKYCTGSCLEGLRKTKNIQYTAIVPTEILEYLWNTSAEPAISITS